MPNRDSGWARQYRPSSAFRTSRNARELFQLIRENVKRSDQVALSCAVFNVAILLLFIRQRPFKSRGAIAEFPSHVRQRSALLVDG